MNYVEDLRKIVGHRPLILVGAVTIIIDDNKILLQKRKTTSYGMWGLPGGLMELGESTEDTARREVFEETGLTIGKLKLIDVFSGADYFIRVLRHFKINNKPVRASVFHISASSKHAQN